ncbi:MAG: hypothetical protein A2381_18210 [Bdellovibrionales bacterium RIFOXYB1_FULL_37_110]|nr:MAG: hypothetical protein A2417_06675 [Bdellovibrionales bacterium RIFOXYC1_FULL_37_79]OFZ58607.1 MAG: hypothetical protein A2381_18210 [Bdellovibrionales bacterium RIFOXYB1_FULL_37_110]OFZ61731.1 MAG: hypothetical protein A2577_19480 [Bdellovibrionales bacterium RIFOXYD1_FULL_36_51]
MKNKLQKISLLSLALGYFLNIAVIWLNEIFDLPSLLLNSEATPINWNECLIETACMLFLFFTNAWFIKYLFSQIKLLEGLIPVCCICKKVCTPSKQWVPFETYIQNNSEAKCSHRICPECQITGE